MREILRLEGIRFFRDNFELSIDEFSVKEGEIFCLLGENGSGKTTFLSIIAFLLKPCSGGILLMGEKTLGLKEKRDFITMVFQRPVLFKGSVFENIILPLKWKRKRSDRGKIEFLVDKFGISRIKDKRANEISGGEAQRVCLVRALLLNPKILVLDEPFSSIDPISSHEIISEVIKIAKEEGMTVIFSTHNPEEAVHAERVGVMMEGKIVQWGSFKDILFKPLNEKVAKIFGSTNIIEGRIIKWMDGIGRVKSNDKEIEVLTEIKEGEVALFLRPENVIISKELNLSSARNNLKCTVKEILFKEVGVDIILDCGFPLISFVTRPSFENLNIKIGDTIYASFKASSIHAVRK